MRASTPRTLVVGQLDPKLHACLREQGAVVEAFAGSSSLQLLREMRRLKPQLVHAREQHGAAALIARSLGVPCVIEAQAGQPAAALARAARIAARTICGGTAQRDALLAEGAPPARTAVMRGFIDAPAARKKPALAEGRWVMSAAPIDEPDRGIADLILAFLSVARSRPSARLLLAGTGAGARAISQADAAGLRGRVAWMPADPAQLPALFGSATVVVGPSRSPAYADAILEAMAGGAPVVASAVGPHPAWVREGRTGFLVPAHAPVALAARLAQLLDDRQLGERMGQAAQQLALEASTPRARATELSRAWLQVSRPLATAHVPLLQTAGRLQSV